MSQPGDPVAKMVYMGELYDLYGSLLTDRQREVFEMHYMQDLSLAEIANTLGITRQACYDLLLRSQKSLEHYEAKMGLWAAGRGSRARGNHV